MEQEHSAGLALNRWQPDFLQSRFCICTFVSEGTNDHGRLCSKGKKLKAEKKGFFESRTAQSVRQKHAKGEGAVLCHLKEEHLDFVSNCPQPRFITFARSRVLTPTVCLQASRP